MRASPYLFVYGSLMAGAPEAGQPRLEAWAKRLRPATLSGTVTQVEGFPAATPGPHGSIAGEVWELLQPDLAWPTLDAWEGPAYRRTMVSVHLNEQGFDLECWAYVLADPASRL